ncbi:hypothetical protein A2W14_05980 [Candidatus Gottesmanbacteria bacterium RBG_16_37_8]|uniref:Thioredoxin domain-containing protein n=1 Tax=Candidatus Gottesmanbacteria bacterium RBG_16_37_8 TaxID=1798371 RepID=A0A1F5YUU8_9BACT|nr:MAG: hypothetical protein A2W14_05980 [Candidatus Gottesmanbacteria bacterium RBG_16_37_8]
MLKKILLFLLLIILLLNPLSVLSQNNSKITLYFFWTIGCPHCGKEKIFLKSLQEKYPNLEVKDYEISKNKKNLDLLIEAGKELKADVSGVPFTVVGRNYIIGYRDDETTGREIESKIILALESGSEDVVARDVDEVKLPFFGIVSIKDLSLPAFTFVIALADGFNPCAMWVLIFLISLLIGMHDKFKMIVLGSAFILASGVVYFLFLSAWLNLFLFLGFIFWIRTLIGGVALAAGGYNLREFFTNKEGVCKVTGSGKRRKIFEKLKQVTASKNFLLAIGGIIVLAFVVNLVELICSAGLPAVYTKVLTLSKLPTYQYYAYLLFYILIFMLDDLIIFWGAIFTFHLIGINTKYARFSHLIGGIAMLLIGLLMIFKPELLMFG